MFSCLDARDKGWYTWYYKNISVYLLEIIQRGTVTSNHAEQKTPDLNLEPWRKPGISTVPVVMYSDENLIPDIMCVFGKI